MKISKTIPFTTKKYKEMQKKVADLEAEREVVMERLVEARGMGDLSENGAYKYAKFELGNIGRQLKRFKGLLAKGFAAPKNTGPKGLVDFGSIVTIQKLNSPSKKPTITKNTTSKPKKLTFTIVSKHESDPSNGTLAFSSPMGKELMRKKVGDKISVKTPVGLSKFLITKIL